MQNQQLQRYFLLGLLAANLILIFFIFRPFFTALVVAITFAVIFHPVYRALLKVLGGQASLASLVTTILVLVIVITPLTFFGLQIFQEARNFYLFTNVTGLGFAESLASVSQESLDSIFPSLTLNVQQYARQAVGWLLQHSGQAFSSIAQLFLSLFLSLLALYYALKDGPKLLKAVISLSPFLDRYDQKIVRRLHSAVFSVVWGALVIALLQGLLAGIGFKIFGVPNPALWGSVAVLAALIPNVGTALVAIPAIGYLFLSDEIPLAIGLLVWSVIIVGMIDNLLRPKLIERGLRVHPFLILLAVLGGIIFFGPVGFLIGPLVLSLLFALMDIYPLIFSSGENRT